MTFEEFEASVRRECAAYQGTNSFALEERGYDVAQAESARWYSCGVKLTGGWGWEIGGSTKSNDEALERLRGKLDRAKMEKANGR